ATRHASASAVIAAGVADAGFGYLKAPIKQVTGLDTPIPYSKPMEEHVLPDEDKIVEAVRQALSTTLVTSGMDGLSPGPVGPSRKEHEHRLPVHPLHVDRIDADLRERIFLEQGYGERFGVADAQLGPLVAGLRARQELLAGCDVIVLPKPTEDDIAELR